MRRSENFELLPIDPKVERTYRRLIKEKKDREMIMAYNEEKKALRDYVVDPSLQLHHASTY